MSEMDPRLIIFFGFLLVVMGFLIPFLMVLGYLKSTFLLGFVGYGASMGGLVTGIVGAAMYARSKGRED
jgi:hypothetical protein